MNKYVKWAGFAVGGLVFGGLLLGAACWTIGGFAASNADADNQFAAWKKAGLPAVAGEVDARQVAEKFNAQPALAKLLSEKPNKVPADLGFEEGWQSGETAKFLLAEKSLMDQVALAVAKPAYRVERDYDEGIWIEFPEYARYKTWAKILTTEAVRLAHAGDHRGAVERLRSARRLGALLHQDPSLISLLVAIAVDKITLRGAGMAASEMADDSVALTHLKEMLNETEWNPDLGHNFGGEAYSTLATFRNSSVADLRNLTDPEKSAKYKPSTFVRNGLPNGRLERAASAELMRFWNEFYPRIAAGERGAKLGREMDQRSEEFSASSSWPKKIAAILISVYGISFTALDTLASERNVMDAFIDVLIHRERTGAWPATLSVAGVSASRNLDQITGQPLGYHASGGEVRIWHVGPNLKDDGGKTSREAGSKSHDAVFLHPWPKSWRNPPKE